MSGRPIALALVLTWLACRPHPPTTASVDASPPRLQTAVPADAAAETAREESRAEESLQQEAPEADPRSATVKLKLLVIPADVGATVFWGGKKLGVAGTDPVEIERPRGSGPMDLVIKASGFLPYHTRLFTDRDDRLTVRLVRTHAASGMLGYRRSSTTSEAAPDAGP